MLTDIIHAPIDELLNEASRVRIETFGNDIDLCAIINIKSGRCSMNCRFCAQSQHYHTTAETFSLLPSEALSAETQKLWTQKIHRVGWVASGGSPTEEELDVIVESAETLLANEGSQQICASLGQMGTSMLNRLKSAGLGRYHHNLETSERFYPSICSTQRWQDRRATVARVKELGWSVCCGGLFGIGETWEDRWQLAITLQTLEVDSVPINFFNPVIGTPLADQKPLSIEEALRIVVLFRLMLPQATIRICGGRPVVFTEREQDKLLVRAGANALMTGNYLTTSGISPEIDRQRIENV